MSQPQFSQSQIDRFYSLSERYAAIKTAVHALDHVARTNPTMSLDRLNACELLMDGIANAFDGRATGKEWRTIRHTYRSERDGPNPPTPEDRRCQRCGAIDPAPFSRCGEHC